MQIKAEIMQRALHHWTLVMGGGHNGQLEAFLGTTLASIGELITHSGGVGWILDVPNGVGRQIELLASENYTVVIKAWMARNEH